MNSSFKEQKDLKQLLNEKHLMPIRDYWHLYAALLATGILTAFAGVYLGLAPSKTGEIVFLDGADALRRIFFAMYYALSFLLVAEGATLFAKDKLIKRDVEMRRFETGEIMEDVKAQRYSMTAMLCVSVVAIVATTVAAGTMLASWLGALDNYVTIPAAAQSWVVLGPPALLVFDVVCVLIYQQNSKKAELDRWVEQKKRLVEASAKQAWADEYTHQYSKAAPEAARRAARAAADADALKWGGVAADRPAEQPAEVERGYVTPRSEPDVANTFVPPDPALAIKDGDTFEWVKDFESTQVPTEDGSNGNHSNDLIPERAEGGAGPESPM